VFLLRRFTPVFTAFEVCLQYDAGLEVLCAD
jgi:hypothetical protein